MVTKQHQSELSAPRSAPRSAHRPAHLSVSSADELRDYLQARLNPAIAASLDAKLRLAWPMPNASLATQASNSQALPSTDADLEAKPGAINQLTFELRQGQLIWLRPAQQDPEMEHDVATFWFAHAQDVCHVLSGSDNAYGDFMQRFMAAELSSDGYLPWAFTLLSLFRGGPELAVPQ